MLTLFLSLQELKDLKKVLDDNIKAHDNLNKNSETAKAVSGSKEKKEIIYKTLQKIFIKNPEYVNINYYQAYLSKPNFDHLKELHNFISNHYNLIEYKKLIIKSSNE